MVPDARMEQERIHPPGSATPSPTATSDVPRKIAVWALTIRQVHRLKIRWVKARGSSSLPPGMK